MRFLNNIKLLIVQYVVKIALHRPAPDRIPTSDPEKMRSRNYYSVFFSSGPESWKFLVRSIEKHGMTGYLWTDPTNSNPIKYTILNSSIPSLELEIQFYYREMKLKYSSSA